MILASNDCPPCSIISPLVNPQFYQFYKQGFNEYSYGKSFYGPYLLQNISSYVVIYNETNQLRLNQSLYGFPLDGSYFYCQFSGVLNVSYF